MFRKFWRFLKTSSQNSNASLPAIEVPPSAIDVEKDEGDKEVDSEAKMWFDRGNEQYEQGNFQEALVSYDRSIELKYNAPKVWEKRGLALQKLGDYQGAIDSNNTAFTLYRYSANPDSASVSQSQESFLSQNDRKSSFNKALEFKPDNYEAWYNRGVVLGNLAKWEEARFSYDKALEFKPDYHNAWYNRGVVLGNLVLLEEAIASYDKALEFKPDYHDAWYNRGVILGNLGLLEDAIASYDKALEFKPDYHDAWYNRGVILGNLGLLEDAIASYDKALELKSDYHDTWNNRAFALDDLGRREDAIASFDKALQFKKDLHVAWSGRGVALYKLGRLEEARFSYDKALEFKPDLHVVWNHRGVALGDLGRLEDAIASWDKALQFKPDDHEAWNNRGAALHHLGRQEDAIASWDKALEFKPDFHEAWNNRGVALGNLGLLEDAIASWDKALELKSDYHDTWNDRGIALSHLGRFEDAIASYDKALKFKPHFHNAWNNRGTALNNLGSFEDAIASYDKALEIKPDFHNAWNNRGTALGHLGRFEDAIASYDKALEIKPDFHNAWNNRGILLNNLGRLEDAINSYDKALEIKPDFHDAWNNRGLTLGHLGKFEDAINSYDKALEIKPDFHDAWNNRGLELGNLGRLEDAIASYDKALEFKPDFHEAWSGRGVALANLGLLEDAIASYDKALKIKPDFHEAWSGRGVALANLGLLEDAIASYDKALEFKPDFHEAWNNRGVALGNLGLLENAIASYDKALEFKPDYHDVWLNRSIEVSNAPGYNQLVYEILQGQFPNSPPVTRTLLTHNLTQRGYEGQVLTLQAGLEYCHQNTCLEGYGKLHQALGNAHYSRGKLNSPYTYWNKATTSYKEALKTLTPDTFLRLHIQVLQKLIKTLVSLNQIDEANKLRRDATDLLHRLLQQQNYSQLTEQQLTDKLVSFEQLTVNIFIQSGQFAEALATAETDKNVCLSWLLDALPIPDYQTEETVTHTQIQQLLNPTTCAIYWHLGDAALTTFIIKSDGLLSPETCFSDFPDEFEQWVKEWNQEYINYQSQGKTSQLNHPWRAGMASKFDRLKEILQISAIEKQLEGITDLILIPHRDLHRFPIHALFDRDLAISYLPSAAVGINLKQRFTEFYLLSTSSDPPKSPLRRGTLNAPIPPSSTETLNTPISPSQTESLNTPVPPFLRGVRGDRTLENPAKISHLPPSSDPPKSPLRRGTLNAPIPPSQTETLNTPVPPFLRGVRGDLSILSIENPRSIITDKNGQQKRLSPLPAAEIESEIICRMFDKPTRLKEDAATLNAVETLWQQPHDIFHFTGHGSYNFDNPLESTLYLSCTHRLTVREIIKHDLSNYQLICLPACETALTDKQTILAEYVGLTSGFMRAGVGCVVSTLWPVESGASTLLMIHFYRQWREAGQPLRVALKNAQKWLREATREDLAAWYQQEIKKISANSPELSEVETTLIDSLEIDLLALATIELDPPYQHPYYWAAFTVTGL